MADEIQGFEPTPPGEDEALFSALLTMDAVQVRQVLSQPDGRALRWVRAAARMGLAEAQLRLGRMLLSGEGVQADRQAALGWFSKAAEGGDAEAMNMLGRCAENGWGQAVDLAMAASWYGRAAQLGDAWAQYNLGHLYLNGAGVARDAAQARTWYRRAADRGHARAMNLVGRCLEQGWGALADPDAAADWYRRSAEAGYFRGQYNHASMLRLKGREEEARAWFGRALAAAPDTSREAMRSALELRDDDEPT